MTVTFKGIEGIKAHRGQRIGPSQWHEVTQEQINMFADATKDRNWIHVDSEKAKDCPFGRTIAHGYWTLSMLIPLKVWKNDRRWDCCAMASQISWRP